MKGPGIATFLGGVAPDSSADLDLAYQCGRVIGRNGLSLFHGGYNGLMECVARGVAEEGADVVAVTLNGKEEWGSFNDFVTRAIFLDNLGERMNTLLSNAKIVLAMAGGVGTLHEVTAAIWYAGNVRRIPVALIGKRAENLLHFLKDQKWIYETPTRPVDFLSVVRSAEDLDSILSSSIFTPGCAGRVKTNDIEQMLLNTAMTPKRYVCSDGTVLGSHFDAFRLCEDPKLIKAAAIAIAEKVNEDVDAVVGIALGGASLATLVAQVLQKPLAIVRAEPKAYGVYSLVEGSLPDGCSAALIDDVVRTGTNMLKACEALQNKGISVKHAACLMRRGETVPAAFEQLDLPLHALFKLPDNHIKARDDQSGNGTQ